jgi:hypothetical protein
MFKMSVDLIPERIKLPPPRKYVLTWQEKKSHIQSNAGRLAFLLIPYTAYVYIIEQWGATSLSLLLIIVWRLLESHMASLFQFIKIPLNSSGIMDDIYFQKSGAKYKPKKHTGSYRSYKKRLLFHFGGLYLFSHYLLGAIPFLFVPFQNLSVFQFFFFGTIFLAIYSLLDLAYYHAISPESQTQSIRHFFYTPLYKIAGVVYGGIPVLFLSLFLPPVSPSDTDTVIFCVFGGIMLVGFLYADSLPFFEEIKQ